MLLTVMIIRKSMTVKKIENCYFLVSHIPSLKHLPFLFSVNYIQSSRLIIIDYFYHDDDDDYYYY